MTYVAFYLSSSGLFYGYCYQGNYYCSYDIERDLVVAITLDDYIAKLSEARFSGFHSLYICLIVPFKVPL